MNYSPELRTAMEATPDIIDKLATAQENGLPVTFTADETHRLTVLLTELMDEILVRIVADKIMDAFQVSL